MRRILVSIRLLATLAGVSFLLVGSAGNVAEPDAAPPEVPALAPSAPSPEVAPFVEARLVKDASVLTDATTGAGLPDGWPTGLPLPPGAEAVFTRSVERAGADAMSAWFSAPDLDLVSFFERELPRRGWDIVEPMSASRFYYAITPRWVAGVIVGDAGQGARWYEGAYDFYVYVFPSTL